MHNFRRLISLFLAAAILILTVILTGCEKTDSEVARIPQFFLSTKEYNYDSVYETEYILYNSFVSARGGVSMVMYGTSDDETFSYSFLKVSDSGKISKKEIFTGKESRLHSGLFYGGGKYTLFYRNFGSGEINFESEIPLTVDTYDDDFNLLQRETTDIFSPLRGGNVNIIKNGDYYYISVGESTVVTRYDMELNKVDSVDFAGESGSNTEVIDLVNGSDGKLYIVCRDEYTWGITLYDYNSGEIQIKDELSDLGSFMSGAGEYLLFCYDDMYIFGVTPDGIVEKMMVKSDLGEFGADHLFSSILHNGVYTLFNIEPGKIVEENFTLKTPPEDNREILTITVLGQVEEDLIEAAAYYNRTNLNYRIVIDDKAYQKDDYREAFNKQILDNTVGDIIIPNRNDNTDTTYTQKGIYEDLYPYLDADGELSREEFFPNVLTAMEVDGHLYGIWRLFIVETYFVPEGGLPPTYENILTLQNENPDLGIIPYGTTNNYVLEKILQQNRSYFDSAEKIGGDAMRQALLIADKYPNPKENTGQVYVSDTDDRYYYQSDLINDSQGYIVASKIRMQTPAIPVGNPIPEGEPQNYINPGVRLCISSSSDKKDAAWEFIKYYLKIPFGGNGISGMTTLKTVFDEIKSSELSENAKLIAEFGEDYSQTTIGFGSGGSYSVPLATAEDYAAFEALIDSCVYPTEFEGELLDIIYEEASPYFMGKKSIDEVLEIIENRAGNYIAEKS
jgi:hypothetical protein